jgi:hypothetical protein
MFCARCLESKELTEGNFCPTCGRSIKLRCSSPPTIAELTSWKSRAVELLPKLQAMRRSLEHEHKAMETRLDLMARRLRSAVSAEKALSAHLHDICQRLRIRSATSGDDRATAKGASC